MSESFIFDRIDVKGEKPKKPFDECFQEGMGTELMAPLLYSLVRFVRPQTILEIGLGYTTPWLAKGIEDNGEIHLDGNADMNYFKKPYNPQMIGLMAAGWEPEPLGLLAPSVGLELGVTAKAVIDPKCPNKEPYIYIQNLPAIQNHNL